MTSNNDVSENDPIFGEDDIDLKASNDSSTVIERKPSKPSKSHGRRSNNRITKSRFTPGFRDKAIQYGS